MKGSPVVYLGALILTCSLMLADLAITNYFQSHSSQTEKTQNENDRSQ